MAETTLCPSLPSLFALSPLAHSYQNGAKRNDGKRKDSNKLELDDAQKMQLNQQYAKNIKVARSAASSNKVRNFAIPAQTGI
jgi:hypothetical protein